MNYKYFTLKVEETELDKHRERAIADGLESPILNTELLGMYCEMNVCGVKEISKEEYDGLHEAM